MVSAAQTKNNRKGLNLNLASKMAAKLSFQSNIQGVSKKLNKSEIALRLCKAPQYTKFFIEIGCLGSDNVV